jgi:TetR/AcrR family transcriptional regulator, repressor for neighboring sulfatase
MALSHPDSPVDDDTAPTDRPLGRDAVREALVLATTELIVERGLAMSVREIAARAGVNHGLVHTYFGSKDGLLAAAFDEINARAAAERDVDGFPPRDLAARRNGEIAKALARVIVESDHDLFGSHPVTSAWREALAASRPDLTAAEVNERVMIATTLGLGWALFSEHMSRVMELDERGRRSVDQRVAELVAEIGGIPDRDE